MVFISGVCTFGPGKIVDKLLKEPLRSHHDIIKAQTTTIQTPSTSHVAKSDINLFKQAKKFYEGITKTLVTLGLSCDFSLEVMIKWDFMKWMKYAIKQVVVLF